MDSYEVILINSGADYAVLCPFALLSCYGKRFF